jgi:hypothetical protein
VELTTSFPSKESSYFSFVVPGSNMNFKIQERIAKVKQSS